MKMEIDSSMQAGDSRSKNNPTFRWWAKRSKTVDEEWRLRKGLETLRKVCVRLGEYYFNKFYLNKLFNVYTFITMNNYRRKLESENSVFSAKNANFNLL